MKVHVETSNAPGTPFKSDSLSSRLSDEPAGTEVERPHDVSTWEPSSLYGNCYRVGCPGSAFITLVPTCAVRSRDLSWNRLLALTFGGELDPSGNRWFGGVACLTLIVWSSS